MLHARHPVIPPAQVHNFTLPIDLDNVEESVKSVLHRAKMAEKAGIIAGENLKIAQHRDIYVALRDYQRKGVSAQCEAVFSGWFCVLEEKGNGKHDTDHG